MAQIRVMFIGHGPSDLPEDRVVNTFYFNTAADFATHSAFVIPAVTAFYESATGAGTRTNALGAYLSPWVQRPYELKMYDMSTPKPRIPSITLSTLPAVLAPQGFPEEVAVCITTKGAPPEAPRRRGRLFFGPIVNSATAIQSASSTLSARPSVTLTNDLAGAAAQLASLSSTVGWSVRSTRPAENYVLITRGYVDNAIDIQRRRGPKASARTLW